MAIYHLSVKPMSRKSGRAATAAIAYRTAEKIHDLTSDQVFDYTRKRGVEHTEIVLPTAAAKLDINWARDRQALWNAAEMAEKRVDARVAREYEVALPHELKAKQRVELVRAFASELANRYGVVVDFAIHKPHRNGDERNHHAHLMTTTRQITATGLGAKADIELGDRDRGKKGLPAAKVEIESVRGLWADLTNSHLQKQQLEIRVDHRSLQAQGIERAATSHLGPAVSGMERRGMETQVGQRLVVEHAQAIQEKRELAAELVAVKREQQELKVSLLELSAMAPRQRKAKVPEAAPQTAAERLVEQVQHLGKQLDAGGVHVSPLSQNEKPQGGAGIDGPQNVPAQPASAPAVGANLSLAEQLDLLSDQVAQGLEREAQGRRLAALQAQRGRGSPGRSASPSADPGGGRSPALSDTAGKSIEEQIHAGADQVAQRLAQEMEREAQARVQRAEVERQRQLKIAPEKALEQQRDKDRGRSLGRSPGDDDGPKRGRDLGRGR